MLHLLFRFSYTSKYREQAAWEDPDSLLAKGRGGVAPDQLWLSLVQQPVAEISLIQLVGVWE